MKSPSSVARAIRIAVTLASLLAFRPLAAAATHTVNFSDHSFSPSALTVNVGDTVVFQNQGGSHTVTGTGSDPFCGDGQVVTSCSVTFNNPGVFPYRCRFHSSGGPQPVGMVGSVTVVGGGGPEKPNLAPFHLNGWTGPVVVSRVPGTNVSDPDFYDDQDIWVDWAIANLSLTAGITSRFYTELLVDGESRASWFHDGLTPDTYNKIEDYNLGKLSPRTHVLTLVTDHTSVVDEADESDNSREISIRVLPSIANKHVVLVSDFSYNPPSLTVRKGDTVDFRNLEGSHTATGTGTDPFCGNNAIPEVCSVTFNTVGRFPYRCLFHSSGGPTPSGMIGEIRVLDVVQAEKAVVVAGPYAPAGEAVVNYPQQTVAFPVPAGPTFWRLKSSVPLQITRVQAQPSSIVLSFGL